MLNRVKINSDRTTVLVTTFVVTSLIVKSALVSYHMSNLFHSSVLYVVRFQYSWRDRVARAESLTECVME